MLEYALGGNPSELDVTANPKLYIVNNNLVVSFFRIKSSVNSNIVITPQFRSNLESDWSTSALRLEIADDQSDVPSSDYEKVYAFVDSGDSLVHPDCQFIRIVISYTEN